MHLATQELHKHSIDIVLTSPLRRCLDTTYHMFKDHPDKPKIVVYPHIREYCESNCDIGGGKLNMISLFVL
jgi:phosphohistidine phosphatase SixA